MMEVFGSQKSSLNTSKQDKYNFTSLFRPTVLSRTPDYQDVAHSVKTPSPGKTTRQRELLPDENNNEVIKS